MVVFSKKNYTLNTYNYSYERYNKKITSRIIHWKKIQALYGAEKKCLSLKTCKKTFQPDQTPPPPPLEVKWSLPYSI